MQADRWHGRGVPRWATTENEESYHYSYVRKQRHIMSKSTSDRSHLGKCVPLSKAEISSYHHCSNLMFESSPIRRVRHRPVGKRGSLCTLCLEWKGATAAWLTKTIFEEAAAHLLIMKEIVAE